MIEGLPELPKPLQDCISTVTEAFQIAAVAGFVTVKQAEEHTLEYTRTCYEIMGHKFP